jgi:fibronectin type 3 domain-containing protein
LPFYCYTIHSKAEGNTLSGRYSSLLQISVPRSVAVLVVQGTDRNDWSYAAQTRNTHVKVYNELTDNRKKSFLAATTDTVGRTSNSWISAEKKPNAHAIATQLTSGDESAQPVPIITG